MPFPINKIRKRQKMPFPPLLNLTPLNIIFVIFLSIWKSFSQFSSEYENNILAIAFYYDTNCADPYKKLSCYFIYTEMEYSELRHFASFNLISWAPFSSLFWTIIVRVTSPLLFMNRIMLKRTKNIPRTTHKYVYAGNKLAFSCCTDAVFSMSSSGPWVCFTKVRLFLYLHSLVFHWGLKWHS